VDEAAARHPYQPEVLHSQAARAPNHSARSSSTTLKGVALVRFPNGEVRRAELLGTRPMAWADAR